MKKALITANLLLLAFATFAQNTADALRLSTIQYGGTARMMGVGNAFTALGADFGAISQNPASLAQFRSDEFVVTPTVRYANTRAAYPGGETTEEESGKFQFANVGLVFNTTPRESDWKSFNWAIGFNQLANYHQSIYYEGSSGGSIVTSWWPEAEKVLNAGGGVENIFNPGAALAVQTEAIYKLDGQPATYDFIGNENAVVDRAQLVNTYGRTNEMVMAFAGNYGDRLYVGATVGVPFFNYRQESSYTEVDPGGGEGGNVANFDRLEYNEYLRTSGVGVNLKLGAAYRVTQSVRLGAAIHTPSVIALTDRTSYSLEYAFENANGYFNASEDTEEGVFSYQFRTPFRAMAGGALLLKKYGFLSADIEWVDYGSGRFNLTSDDPSTANEGHENDLNRDIQREYGSAFNARIGAEIALNALRLRAGYNLLGKAAADQSGYNSALSFGIGARGKRVYFDVGYRLRTSAGSVQTYTKGPLVTLDTNASDVLFTFGFKF